jgi:hypothetical protein
MRLAVFIGLLFSLGALAEDPIKFTPTAKTEPAPVQSVQSVQICYMVACKWTAETGKPVKGEATCLAGFVADHLPLTTSTGATIQACVCCPAVDPPKRKE